MITKNLYIYIIYLPKIQMIQYQKVIINLIHLILYVHYIINYENYLMLSIIYVMLFLYV